MGIGHMLSGLWILDPTAVHHETIFILAGSEQQTDNPFSRVRAFHRRGFGVPTIKIASHINLAGFRSQERENYLLFFQGGESG
jgi:hypothetical protein